MPASGRAKCSLDRPSPCLRSNSSSSLQASRWRPCAGRAGPWSWGGRSAAASRSFRWSTPEDAIRRADLIEWLNSALDVLQAAADGQTFFERAARAAVGMVGLDWAFVLMYRDPNWEAKATFPPSRTASSPASRRVLLSARQ